MSSFNFPCLNTGQHAVIVCEVTTGIVLNLDFERNVDNSDCYHVFDSLNSAQLFCKKLTADTPDFEAHICNYLGKFIESYTTWANK